MKLKRSHAFAAAALATTLALPAVAQTVKVTSLGGIDGEFCPQDRALVFEDPNGTRILYDPGRTVAGAADPRLGKIDIVLVSHMHGDHVGNAHNKAPNSGSCESPDMSVSAMPNSSAVNIALAKKSKIVTGSEMPPFFAAKLKANGGNPADSILARFGGSVTLGGVRIATVSALVACTAAASALVTAAACERFLRISRTVLMTWAPTARAEKTIPATNMGVSHSGELGDFGWVADAAS